MTEENFDNYVGKVLGEDFTREDIERDYPEYNIFVSRLGALALAGFKPDRLRVWLDDEDRVVKMVTG